jgi:murein DD-endopeptidase MepM/ murein hydrolase activator NlpD
MNIRTIIAIICCAALSLSGAKASGPKKTTHRRHPVTHRITDPRAMALMADRVGFKKNIELREISARREAILEARENLLYPADELYGSNWNTEWVNPFRKSSISFPDTFAINCSSFVLPIIDEPAIEVTSNYGPRHRRMHWGIDLKLSTGDTVRAAFDGRVRVKNYEGGGYGNYLVIRHPNGLETVYAHLSKFIADQNDIVRAGQAIGLGGSTGRSTGPHLHFETRFLGRAINPADIINFDIGIPYQRYYVFHNVKQRGRNTNVYEANEYTSENIQMAYHRVKKGDTLGEIARMYGTTIANLCRLNGLSRRSKLRIGQAIRCTEGGSVNSKVSKRRSRVQIDEDELAQVETENQQSTHASRSSKASKPVYYRIKKGDTLGAIAQRHGTTITKICQLNGISRTSLLQLGHSLRCS